MIKKVTSPENAPLGANIVQGIDIYGVEFATQISAVFAQPHWPAQPAMIGYTL
jgi:hypothetical protein